MSAAAALPLVSSSVNPAFARDVLAGLTRKSRKTIPASWLYDEVGSALFEVITLLPEYGLTRADAALLERSAAEIVRTAKNPGLIVELGSGTGAKTRHVLAAAARRGPVRYHPIDISATALGACETALGPMDRVRVTPVEASYFDGIDIALTGRCPGENAMVLFLGSTIGNFSPTESVSFLRNIRRRMKPSDTLLLGADLVKPRAKLLGAYDDAAGVTAAFNKNLLTRINRELDADFDSRKFVHEARYNERLSRVEMHLRALIPHDVRLGALDLTVSFAGGETIWTESSHKFRPEDVAGLGERAGWTCLRQWFDRDWGFTETLFQLQ